MARSNLSRRQFMTRTGLVVGGVALQLLLNKGERGEGHAEGVATQRLARPHSGRYISFQLISKRHALLLSGG